MVLNTIGIKIIHLKRKTNELPKENIFENVSGM